MPNHHNKELEPPLGVDVPQDSKAGVLGSIEMVLRDLNIIMFTNVKDMKEFNDIYHPAYVLLREARTKITQAQQHFR